MDWLNFSTPLTKAARLLRAVLFLFQIFKGFCKFLLHFFKFFFRCFFALYAETHVTPSLPGRRDI